MLRAPLPTIGPRLEETAANIDRTLTMRFRVGLGLVFGLGGNILHVQGILYEF